MPPRPVLPFAQLVNPRFRRRDLVLPAAKAAQVDEILAASKSGGLAILFTGSSGTGKAMAAEVIAAELGLPLYRVDLTQVMSKYIGETEKNLGRIFDAAGSVRAVLFFDEADALFGKRTDVKDAHDRYANQEVGYLLERVERLNGLVILASNMKSNIDSAFQRRLRYVVDFTVPDAGRI